MATVSQKPSKLAYERRALRVLMMVHELHKAGFQLLRIAPGMSPSGSHWRCAITPVSNIEKSHGARLVDYDTNVAHYTSGEKNEYSGWKDARTDTARDLAAKFMRRFPDIVEKSLGKDWEYVGWFVEMLGVAEQGAFPIAYADWPMQSSLDWLPTTRKSGVRLPMPPGGRARGNEDRA